MAQALSRRRRAECSVQKLQMARRYGGRPFGGCECYDRARCGLSSRELYWYRYVVWTLLAAATSLRRSSRRPHLPNVKLERPPRPPSTSPHTPRGRCATSLAGAIPRPALAKSPDGCGRSMAYVRIRRGVAARLVRARSLRYKQEAGM